MYDPDVSWRRGRDSNPRYPLRYVRFRGGSFQPLTHLSASDKTLDFGTAVVAMCSVYRFAPGFARGLTPLQCSDSRPQTGSTLQ